MKTQGESLQWYKWSFVVTYLRELGTPGKEKIKHLEPRMWYDEPLRKAGIEFTRWNTNTNYIILILHQFKLMTSNGFGILLILVERIKINILQTWEGLQWSTNRIETTNKLIWEHRNRSLEQTAVRIEKERRKEMNHR